MKPKKNKKYQLPTTKMFTPKFPTGGIIDPNSDPNINQFRNNSLNVTDANAFNAHQAAIPLAQANTSRLITDPSGNRIRLNADGTKQVYDSTGTKLLPTFDNGGLNNLYGTPTNNQYAQTNNPTNPNGNSLNQQYKGTQFQQSDFNNAPSSTAASEYGATSSGLSNSGVPILSSIGQIAGIGDTIGKPIKDNAEQVDPTTGKYKNIDSATEGAVAGSLLNPYEALTDVMNDPNASTGDKVVTGLTGGAGHAFFAKDLYERKQKANMSMVANDPARKTIMGENAQNGVSNAYMNLPQARKGGQIDINNTEGLYHNPNTPYQNSNNNAREDMDYKFQTPNSEVEKQENAISPDGTFKQFNGPSHEDGGIKTNLPQGAIIFSDKLKPQGSKETFAKLNTINNTKKEDKIISDKFATKESKATAQLMDSVKNKNSQALFEQQEAQKQLEEQKNKEAFANGLYKYGGVVSYKNGGIHIKPSQIGSFTRFAKKHNMGVQEAASHVLTHKDSFSSSIVKKANFAHNAAGWKHEEGGIQYYSNGGIQDANYNYPKSYGQVYKDTHVQQFKGMGIWEDGGENNKPEYISNEDMYNPPLTNYEVDQPQMNMQFDKYGKTSFIPNQTSGYPSNIPTKQPYDWKSGVSNGLGTLAQSAGQLAYLAEQGKHYDKQNMYNYRPTLLDPSAALRDADIQNNQATYNIKEASGGNAGNYLSNRIALAGENTLNKADIRTKYANANSGISNQGQIFNIGNQYRTDDINAANKGQALTNYYSTLGSLGTNTASGIRDYKADQMQQQQMNMLPYMYTNPEFQSYWNNYKKGK